MHNTPVLVFALGATVHLGVVEAVVSQVLISADGVQYKVVWWYERTRTETWVMSHEITGGTNYRLSEIGFHTLKGE